MAKCYIDIHVKLLSGGIEVYVLKSGSKKKRRFSHRTKIDTMACILRDSNESSRKTKLISTCNLNSAQFDLFKNYLVEAGLLVSTSEDGAEILETTEKGKEFLTDYHKIRSLLE